MSVSWRVLTGLTLTLTGLTASVGAQTSELGWHGELARGAAAARESGKPLFVVFRCVR
jgi:hypothetical protein